MQGSVPPASCRCVMQGMDVVWESVGGDMLQTCVRSLAVKGRLIVIGMMSQYASGWAPSTQKGVAELLLAKSATMTGFFYPHYFRKIKSHLPRLISAWSQGRLHISIDPTRFVYAWSARCAALPVIAFLLHFVISMQSAWYALWCMPALVFVEATLPAKCRGRPGLDRLQPAV